MAFSLNGQLVLDHAITTLMKKSFDIIGLLAETSYFALLWESFGKEIKRIQFAVALQTLMNFRSSLTCILPQVLSYKY